MTRAPRVLTHSEPLPSTDLRPTADPIAGWVRETLERNGLPAEPSGPPEEAAGLAIAATHLRDQAADLGHAALFPGEQVTVRVTENPAADASARLVRAVPPEYAILFSTGLIRGLTRAACVVTRDDRLREPLNLIPNPAIFDSDAAGRHVPFNIQLLRDTLDHVLLHEYAHVARGHLPHLLRYSRAQAYLNEAPTPSPPFEAGLRRFYELDADLVAGYRLVDWLVPDGSVAAVPIPVPDRVVQLLFAMGVVTLELDSRRTPLRRPLAWPAPHPVVRLMLVQGVIGAVALTRFGIPKAESLRLAGKAMSLLKGYASAIGRSERPWQSQGGGRTVVSVVGRERRRWARYACHLLGGEQIDARIQQA